MVTKSICESITVKTLPMANLSGDVESGLMYKWDGGKDEAMVREDRWLTSGDIRWLMFTTLQALNVYYCNSDYPCVQAFSIHCIIYIKG